MNVQPKRGWADVSSNWGLEFGMHLQESELLPVGSPTTLEVIGELVSTSRGSGTAESEGSMRMSVG
jgi:hypothetical protein